jgi:hypothetical protein
MENLKWDEAITKVLEESKKPLHYTEITDLIYEKHYRTGGGATPAATVNKILGSNINQFKEKSPFAKVGMGIFILRKFLDNQDLSSIDMEKTTESQIEEGATPQTVTEIQIENNKIINAFGIYWNRNLVLWKSTPDLLGIQYIGALEVNFKDQRGIYLLHDSRETIYVGQAIEQTLGQRLKHHTSDRLSGRWDRFSWFGFYSVDEKGHLLNRKKFDNLDIQILADILEAILIESIEPRQNRKQGNTFFGIEYLQQESPEIKKQKKEQLIRELTDKL